MAEYTLDMLASRFPEVQGAVAAIKELSADPEIRHQVLLEKQAWRDWLSWTDEVEKQGMEIGYKQGLKQGIEQGEHNKVRSIARNLIYAHLPLEIIITVTGLTREEIEGLCN